MSKPNIIDVDDPSTWPPQVLEEAESWAKSLKGKKTYVSDLEIPIEVDNAFRRSLDRYRLLAFHATRLLDNEVEGIRSQGLRLLTAELVNRRIEAAFDNGALNAAERDQLLRSNVFATGWQVTNRADQVALFLSRSLLDEDVRLIWPLLTNWGGEAIYRTVGRDTPLERRLMGIGRPTLVSVAIDLNSEPQTHLVFPGVLHQFVGHLLGLEGLGADVFYRAPIPPEDIVAIWQPGHPDYDAYPELPRD